MKTMKHLRTFTLGLLLAASGTACEKFLEIPPQGEIPANEALKTPRDVQMLLNSCYDVMRSGKFLGGKVQILSELMADHWDGRLLTGNWLSYHLHNTGIFNQETRDVWSEPYIMIYRCNSLLENMGIVPGMTDAETQRITAEAKFLRALGHFELVRLFGQPYGFTSDNSHPGIPLRLETSQAALDRASVGEVYAAVISDLESAAAVLPATNQGYATSWAAKALLARVYFQMNDFGNAFSYADDVINNGGFALNTDVMARFSPNANTENILESISTGNLDNSGSALRGAFNSSNLINPPGGRLTRDFYDIAILDTADLRGKLWYVLANPGLDNELVLSTRFNENFFNVPVLHLAEMLLIRAESAAENGNTAVAEQDLNTVRNRSNVASVTPGLDAASLLLLIRAERRLEMVLEGNRLQDLKRLGARGVPGVTINGSPWNCNGMAAQLPDEERSGNPTIVLNPEGGC
jgi:hypothetical protein